MVTPMKETPLKFKKGGESESSDTDWSPGNDGETDYDQ